MQVFLCLLYLIYHQTSVMDARDIQNHQKDLYVRSICKPRETLVEVEDEFPEVTNRGVLLSCVPLQRCGGCCSDEAMVCVSVSNHTTTMQLKQFTLNIIELAFFEHSRCECRFRDQL